MLATKFRHQPSIDYPTRKNTKNDAEDNAGPIDDFSGHVHLLSTLRNDCKSGSNEDCNEELRCRSSSCGGEHKRLHSRKCRYCSVRDTIGERAESDHHQELQTIVFQDERERFVSFIIRYEPIDKTRKQRSRDYE